MIRRRKKPRAKRARLPTASQLEAQLWRAFSLWIRLRDRGRCVQASPSCGGPLQAGHLVSRRYRATRYDEGNVFAQCAAHNRAHSLDPHPFTAWYIRQHGEAAYLALVTRSRTISKRPTRIEYQSLLALYGNPSY